VRPVFERNFRWHVKKPLDVAAMNRAVACLVGEHDFSAFRGAHCTAKTTVRTLDGLVWRSETPALMLDAWGRGFLKQMVRNIVGTSVEIGRERWPAGKMAAILQSRNREEAGLTAPAQGLCLMKIYFDVEEYRRAVGAPDQVD
jgi:tRNA pseudouridine38-40 synthase